MGCRCHDIPLCEADVGKLRKALRRMDIVSGKRGEWEHAQENARKGEFSAFELIDAARNAIRNVIFGRRDGAANELKGIRRRIEREIDALEYELSAMQREDASYHAELAAAAAAAANAAKGGRR